MDDEMGRAYIRYEGRGDVRIKFRCLIADWKVTPRCSFNKVGLNVLTGSKCFNI
jgi:hypothetical protein